MVSVCDRARHSRPLHGAGGGRVGWRLEACRAMYTAFAWVRGETSRRRRVARMRTRGGERKRAPGVASRKSPVQDVHPHEWERVVAVKVLPARQR